MKLFNLPNTLGLFSLFCTLSSAGITISEIPSEVQVGEWYDVEYISDRRYEVIAFDLMQWSANEMGSWASGEFVNYHINIDVNHTGYSAWKVPNMENGVYDFFLNAVEVDEHGQWNPNTTYYVRSNKFEIVGGHRALGSKAIAGITVGTVAGVVLLAGIWVVGVRLWRQRKSLAVDLSERNEGGYTDDTGR